MSKTVLPSFDPDCLGKEAMRSLYRADDVTEIHLLP